MANSIRELHTKEEKHRSYFIQQSLQKVLNVFGDCSFKTRKEQSKTVVWPTLFGTRKHQGSVFWYEKMAQLVLMLLATEPYWLIKQQHGL